MNKSGLITGVLFFSLGFSSAVFSSEPDESGIGGTGVSKPDVREFIFNRPDVPDIATDVVDVPTVPDSMPDVSTDFGSAGSIDVPSSIESNIAPTDVIEAPSSADK